MRKLSNKYLDALYLIHRLSSPVLDIRKMFYGLIGYIKYIKDIQTFNSLSAAPIKFDLNLFPVLDEATKLTAFDAHYYYQQLWVFENVYNTGPKKHVDIASTYELSGYLSKVVPTTFLDYRPIPAKMPNLEILSGDVLALPFETNSLMSVSCLHVIEHIGLGRYGDKVRPSGLEEACKELGRVVKPGGKLYLSTPIGVERVCFNAHRVSSPLKLLALFPEFELGEFNVVTDEGEYIQNTNPEQYTAQTYACGMFCLKRKETPLDKPE